MRAFRAAAVTAVLPVVLALGGCSSQGADKTAPGEVTAHLTPGRSPGENQGRSPSGSPGRTPAPGASPAPRAPDADETLVRVTRSGGFAGRSLSLVVKGDGSFLRLDAQAKQTGTGTLSAAALEQLRGALREADFAHLPRVVSTGGTVFDGYAYAIAHDGREVAADQGSLPPGLEKVITALPPFEGE
ncbi:hypothetical protein [Streptomyces sp. NPDC060031]|uniref:hypothetical protein n=1 Tax=Streptomyces sp. NPDC060031 TaxID=3347043 RepID=UPI00369EB56F